MNIEKTNYCVARVKTYTAASIGKAELQNERKNESYANMNVDLSRTSMNVHFKDCGDLTYNQRLQQMVDNKQVSLRVVIRQQFGPCVHPSAAAAVAVGTQQLLHFVVEIGRVPTAGGVVIVHAG